MKKLLKSLALLVAVFAQLGCVAPESTELPSDGAPQLTEDIEPLGDPDAVETHSVLAPTVAGGTPPL